MKKNSLWAVALVLCSVLFLSSCANNDDVVSKQETVSSSGLAISDPQIKKEIEFMRDEKIITESMYQRWLASKRSDVLDEWDVVIDEKGTVRHDGAYRLSNPISDKGVMTDEQLLDRRVVQDMMKESTQTLSSRMKRDICMFSSSGGTISCRVFTQSGNGRTALNQDWKNALIAATNIWNNQGLKLKFKVVDATNTNIVGGYVNVFMQNTNKPWSFADAVTPGTPGYFGETLRINTGSSQTPDVNGKVSVLVHELGHIVGFVHTDEFANNTSIFNTAVVCDDYLLSDSFMYGGISYNKIFTDFSSCDKKNLKYYWGY